MSNILFNIKELPDVIERIYERQYKTNRLIDGKMTEVYVIPITPALYLYIRDKQLKIYGIIRSLESYGLSDLTTYSSLSLLKRKVYKFMLEHYPNCEATFFNDYKRKGRVGLGLGFTIKTTQDGLIGSQEIAAVIKTYQRLHEYCLTQSI